MGKPGLHRKTQLHKNFTKSTNLTALGRGARAVLALSALTLMLSGPALEFPSLERA